MFDLIVLDNTNGQYQEIVRLEDIKLDTMLKAVAKYSVHVVQGNLELEFGLRKHQE